MTKNPPGKLYTLAPGSTDGPLVVLAHGLESAWSSWLPVAAALNPDWRVVALDLPWRPGNEYRWHDRPAGAWLGDGLDQVGRTPDLLVAHSFGANATLELLCAGDRRPGPAVALICPLYREARYPVTWRMFDRARTVFFEHMREGLRARMGGRLAAIDQSVLQTMMELAIDRAGPLGFLTTFRQYAASTELRLSTIDVPTCLITGGADPTLSPDAARALAGLIPDAELRINDDYDHFCHVRHGSGVAAQITDFFHSPRVPHRTVKELR